MTAISSSALKFATAYYMLRLAPAEFVAQALIVKVSRPLQPLPMASNIFDESSITMVVCAVEDAPGAV